MSAIFHRSSNHEHDKYKSCRTNTIGFNVIGQLANSLRKTSQEKICIHWKKCVYKRCDFDLWTLQIMKLFPVDVLHNLVHLNDFIQKPQANLVGVHNSPRPLVKTQYAWAFSIVNLLLSAQKWPQEKSLCILLSGKECLKTLFCQELCGKLAFFQQSIFGWIKRTWTNYIAQTSLCTFQSHLRRENYTPNSGVA